MWRFCGDSCGDLSGPAPEAPGDAWREDPGEGGTVGGTGRSRRRRTARTWRWPPSDSSRRAGTWERPLCSAGTCPQPPRAPGSWGIRGDPGRPVWDCGDTAGKWCRSCGGSGVKSRAAVAGAAAAAEAGGQSGGKPALRLETFGKGWSEHWRSPHRNRIHCPPHCTDSFYPDQGNHSRRRRTRRLGCSVGTQHRASAREYSEHKPSKCCGSRAGWWAPGKKSRKLGTLTLPPSHPWLLLLCGERFLWGVKGKHKQGKLKPAALVRKRRLQSRPARCWSLQEQPWPEERHQRGGGRLTDTTHSSPISTQHQHRPVTIGQAVDSCQPLDDWAVSAETRCVDELCNNTHFVTVDIAEHVEAT